MAPTPAPTPTPAPRPNVLFILTDDLDLDGLRVMPKLKALVTDPGTSFANAFVTTPLCAPSRASILTGQYGHNHGLLANAEPQGGFERWANSGKESSTIATWLKGTGYRTILLGKYINGYLPGSPPYIAPGWDDWQAVYSDQAQDPYYNYGINENGTLVAYGSTPADYLTDVLAQRAVDALRRAQSAAGTQPFFMYLATGAPHTPAIRADKYDGVFQDQQAPRTPSFDEGDVSDKPGWLQAFPLFTDRDITRLDFLYRDRLATLLSVDDLVATVLNELQAEGKLANTLVVFTSDNGFFMGPHRFNRGKGAPYEEAIRVPLVMRGPGVAAGQVRSELVLNIDLAPTFADLAGATAPDVDGRSLVGLFQAGAPAWRSDFMTEFWANTADPDTDDTGIPTWASLRNGDHMYSEYVTGDVELYDLALDRYELDSQGRTASNATLLPFASRLATLKSCRGTACR
jgi:N-acetylglucosamine-6-sulfatase